MGFIVALMLSLLVVPLGARAASFTSLGEFPGGQDSSSGSAVSADGAVVVGISEDEVDNRAFRWSSGVMTSLGVLPAYGASANSSAAGVSADGSVVVGDSGGDETTEAFRWSGGVMTGLGFLAGDARSHALGVSANGEVVVGDSSPSDVDMPEAFRWTDAGMTGLGFLPNGTYSRAWGASANGDVVVGTSDDASSAAVAFRWSNGVMSSLTDFPDWVLESQARAVSADGAFVVGSMFGGAAGEEAFRWTEGQMLGLGFLDPDDPYSWARGVSADGTVVVGISATGFNDNAFVWTEANGMEQLSALLLAHGATGLEGWILAEATGVSADGRWVTGWGFNPDGDGEAFLANISPVPAPPASWLLGSALIAWACVRRRTAR